MFTPKRVAEQLVRHSRLLVILSGLLVCLCILLAGLAILVSREISEAKVILGQAGGTVSQILLDANRLLVQLNKTHRTDCTPQHLVTLNKELFGYRYVRDIGILDAEGRLICTSSLGTLPIPNQAQPAIYVFDGAELWMDEPVLVSDGQIPALVIRRQDFNLVVDPRVTEALYATVDAVWLDLPVGLIPLRFKDASQAKIPALAEAANTYSDTEQLRFSNGALDLFLRAPRTPVVLHINLSVMEMLSRNQHWLVALFGLAFAMAYLCSLALRLKLEKLASMDFRIRYLCNAEHLLCLYQPIVELQTGRVVGCEVLMRLREGQTVYAPDITIPAIQRNGLEWELDRTVSTQALRELCEHLPLSPGFKVALNFFPNNIRFEAIHNHLSPILQASGRRDLQLCIEVTEYGFAPEVIEQARCLEESGYLISVDDFGTGYSNLNVVKRLAPHFLKIDKSFVFEAEDASVKSSLIPEIISIARAVGAQTVAEGIENRGQSARLAQMGVEFGQGYLFGRPLPIEAFLEQLNLVHQPSSGEYAMTPQLSSAQH